MSREGGMLRRNEALMDIEEMFVMVSYIDHVIILY